jgi:protein-disulfide isomerase
LSVPVRLLLSRLLALIALGVSAAMLTDSLLPRSALCAFDAPCHEVTGSAFGTIGGVPLSAVGVIGFAVLFGLSFAVGRWGRLAFRVLALLGGLVGLALIGVQLGVLGRVCPYCLVVDVAAIGIAGLNVVSIASPPREQGVLVESIAWAVLGVLAPVSGVLVVLFPDEAIPPPPPQVAALAVPGKLTVVEAYDFTCPRCREVTPWVEQVVRESKDRVHLARVIVPRAREADARRAARAYLVAQKLGKGEEMAEALIRAPQLDDAACEQMAESLGLSKSEFRAGLADASLDAQLDANVEWVRQASPSGIPAIWVGGERVVGQLSLNSLSEAVRRGEQRLGLRP